MKESQNIEWKESWRDEYIKWICGFANANGRAYRVGPSQAANIACNDVEYQADIVQIMSF
ncbi:MAG: hypothetical protein ABIL62_02625 [Planctomycetota bacterium]